MVLFVACGSSSGPADVVKSFYAAVEKGDVDAAMDLYTDEIIQMLGEEKIKTTITESQKQIEAKGGIESIEVVSEDVKDETAKVNIKLTYKNGESTEEAIDLVKVSGDWKMGFSMDQQPQ
ncbi:MAG: DUF4878 domain-containing protein [Ignavibacteriales bacterium]|nr:DUF4878 domain-containing protein [Ignavibacteriales bacterium]